MFYQILLSPQVKRSIITSNKNGIYKLPKDFMNNLRLRIIGKIRKISKLARIIN